MPVFEYTGFDKQRKKASGVIDAESEKAARLKLRKMGIYPQTLVEEGSSKKFSLSGNVDFSRFTQRIKTQDIALMTRQLSTLVASGIPLVESLTALIDQIENVKLRKILSQVREKVTEGVKLSDALGSHPDIFNQLFCNMINAGETGGALDLVLVRLADFTENQSKLQSKVKSAMMYPLIMTVVGLGLVVLLMVGVIPKITSIFADQEMALPLPTRIVMVISNALSNGWFLLGLTFFIGAVVYYIRRWLKTPKGKLFFDKKMLKMPVFGTLTRQVAISRFSRTLSTLLSSGVPLLSALGIVKNIVSNVVIQNVIEETANSVKEGASIADPLKKSGEFPPLVTHMIAIGEKTGGLEKMLERVADTYDTQVDNTVSAMTTLLEPVMILVMAGIVSFIVMSVLLPILQMGEMES